MSMSGPAVGGFEEGEFEGDSPTEEVAAQIRLRGADPVQLRAQEIEFRQLLWRCCWRGECGRGIVASRQMPDDGALRMAGGLSPFDDLHRTHAGVLHL